MADNSFPTLSGQLAPVAGKIRVTDEVAYLDQALEVLDPNLTILDQLKRANSGAAEADLRTRLAQLGLDAQKIMVPSGVLSGGERLKAALACVLYAERPPQLLMLDEPSKFSNKRRQTRKVKFLGRMD